MSMSSSHLPGLAWRTSSHPKAGISVVIFLSTQTLPELVRILETSRVPVPGLTRGVMDVGQFLAHWGVWIFVGLGGLFLFALSLRALGPRFEWRAPEILHRLRPRTLRRLAVSGLSKRWADLLRSGVPTVEAMRVLAPTVSSGSFRRRLEEAASSVERGESLSRSLNDELWFETEFKRLIEVGEVTGDIEAILDRLAKRYERQARRMIERWSSVIEPLLIIILAALIGTVVMAAILPIVKLQEII